MNLYASDHLLPKIEIVRLLAEGSVEREKRMPVCYLLCRHHQIGAHICEQSTDLKWDVMCQPKNLSSEQQMVHARRRRAIPATEACHDGIEEFIRIEFWKEGAVQWSLGANRTSKSGSRV